MSTNDILCFCCCFVFFPPQLLFSEQSWFDPELGGFVWNFSAYSSCANMGFLQVLGVPHPKNMPIGGLAKIN